MPSLSDLWYSFSFSVDAPRGRCSNSPVPLQLGEAGVTLSSHQADTSGCGLPMAPWTIKTPAGQRVNITLVNFGWHESEQSVQTDNGITGSQCSVYGYIVERSLGMNTTFCGGSSRERHVYLSASNEVEIAFIPSPRRQTSAAFLLQVTSKQSLDLFY